MGLFSTLMKDHWLGSTALSTCHRTGFLDPWAAHKLHQAVIRAWFLVAVLPGLK